MSSGPRIVDMSANLTGRGDLCATISARFAGTGRTVTADKLFGSVDAWSRLPDPRIGETCGQVRKALRSSDVVADPSIVGFRGRSFPGAGGAPTADCFGPPPASLARANRYNADGSPALYLCTVGAAVGRELSELPSVWVQRFSVIVGSLRIADLRSPESLENQLLTAVMWFAELAGAEGHPSQVFSRFVASMVAEQYDGMLVSGVRGDASLLYSNLVIFRPGDEWRKWRSPDQPTPIDASV